MFHIITSVNILNKQGVPGINGPQGSKGDIVSILEIKSGNKNYNAH